MPVTAARLALASLIAIALAGPALSGPGHDHGSQQARINEPAPGFTLTAIDGKQHSLSDYRGKFVVLEWNNFDCPFVRKHYGSGNMQALQKKYGAKEVVWLTICSSAPGKQGYYEADSLRKMTAGDKWRAAAYLLDPAGEVGRAYSARTTPHMYIIDPEGVLIYAGAIDDKPSTKTADIDGATNFVSESLDAALAGKNIEVQTTTPYGCSIKYASAR
jgi:peroxiredoxin